MSNFFNYLEKTRLMIKNRTAIIEYANQNPNAQVLKSDICVRCGCCCFQKPGNLDLNDVDILSKHFKLTVKEFFKQYLILDNINGIWSVLPRRDHQKGGRFIPWQETYDTDSSCVFFKDNSCVIHDKKPVMCRNAFCNDGKEGFEYPSWTKEQLMAIFGWNGEEEEDE
jgi:Fe-S-cluster containining protein